MARKRKAGTAYPSSASASANTARKKTKTAHGKKKQKQQDEDWDPDQEYEINAIIDEDATRYLIQWKDNPVTGEKYADDWQPKEFANRLAIEDWEATKKARRERDSSSVEEVVPAPGPTSKKRGRSRKNLTVLSSSPEQAHAHARAQPQDEELEIGESQQTTSAADEVDSPLFVPENSPSPPSSRRQPQPSVHISDPPSSYAAGAYQNFSSSQIPESAAPKRRRTASPEKKSSQVDEEFERSQQASEAVPSRGSREAQESTRKKSPEASQWQPEEGDTSKTTENTTTTEVSLAPTSSEPARSNPAGFERRANNVVPDSQSLPDSSSFRPSRTQTQSSSAAESRGRGRPPREVTQVALSQLPADTQDSWQGLSSQQPAVTQVEPQPEVAAFAQETQVGNPEAEEVNASQVPAHSQAPVVTASHSEDHPVPSLASRVSAQAEEGQRGISSGTASGSASLPEDDASKSVNSGTEGAPQNSQSSNPQSQIRDDDIRPSTEQTGPGRIDLTRDTQSAPEQSSIAVTPPTARHLSAALRIGNTAPGAGLDSPFPFDTQLPQQSSSTLDQSHNRLTQSQPAATTAARQLLPPWEPSNVTSVPSASSPAQQASSSLPPPPTQSLNTFDPDRGGAPPRPQTPSSPVLSSASAMSSPDPAGQTALEKIRAMRKRKTAESEARLAKSAAARAAARSSASVASDASPPKPSIPSHATTEASASVPAPAPPNPARLASPLLVAQDGSAPRSPSVVPAMEALPEITTEEMNTSEKYPTLLPQASMASEQDQAQRNGSSTSRATPTQQPHSQIMQNPEAGSAYVVPITLIGHQRDQYPQTVYYYQDLIRKFLEERNPDDRLVEKAEHFIERVRAITLHPDLDNVETFTQYDVEPEKQASWDVSCSAKLRFLKGLLGGLRGEKMLVAIVLQSGRLVEILRTFLQGISVSTEGSPSTSSSSEVRVDIVTPGTTIHDPSKADLILCLDNSVHHDDDTIRSLRQRDGSGRCCPFVSLVVPRSIEHIDSHLSPGLSKRARLRALVSGIDQLKGEAGRQEEGQLTPTDTANALVAYLKDTSDDKFWPLAGLSALHDLDSQTESEIEAPEGATASPATGSKRQRIDDLSKLDDINKRVRTEEASELPTTVNLQDVELTHISDSVNKPTQPPQTDVEQRLQRLLQDALERSDDLTSALSDLQYRHEDQRALLIRTTSERDQLTTTASDALLRRTEAQNRESALRTERADLKKDLEDANARLLAHTVPERAETESLRQALAQALAEKGALEKRLEQARRQGDFFREQYQEASNTAQREVAANAELRGECEALRARASGEQAKLRLMGVDARVERLESENRKLKTLLRDREAGIKFRDEEIARSRGRMGTRGTSVPRSPRLASPMGGVRSRQGSPAAGELKGKGSLLHPLRNNA